MSAERVARAVGVECHGFMALRGLGRRWLRRLRLHQIPQLEAFATWSVRLVCHVMKLKEVHITWAA